MTNTVVLRTEQLSKSHGQVGALDQVSISVERGQIYGFLGPSGAGRTAVIGMMLGLLQPSAGQAEVLGQPVTPSRTQACSKVAPAVKCTRTDGATFAI